MEVAGESSIGPELHSRPPPYGYKQFTDSCSIYILLQLERFHIAAGRVCRHQQESSVHGFQCPSGCAEESHINKVAAGGLGVSFNIGIEGWWLLADWWLTPI